MTKPPKDQDQLTEAETVKRRDAALKRALMTPPKPHKPKPKKPKKTNDNSGH